MVPLRILKHDPHELTDKPVRLPDGTRGVIRPFEPVPREAVDEAYAALSPESRYNRFLSAVPELTDEMYEQLIDVDGVDHVALFFVLLPDKGPESILGVARILRYPEDPSSADVAVTVRDEWHGRGIATALLDELMRRRPEGVTRLVTEVAVDNPASLAMLQWLGETRVTEARQGVASVVVELPSVSPDAR